MAWLTEGVAVSPGLLEFVSFEQDTSIDATSALYLDLL